MTITTTCDDAEGGTPAGLTARGMPGAVAPAPPPQPTARSRARSAAAAGWAWRRRWRIAPRVSQPRGPLRVRCSGGAQAALLASLDLGLVRRRGVHDARGDQLVVAACRCPAEAD